MEAPTHAPLPAVTFADTETPNEIEQRRDTIKGVVATLAEDVIGELGSLRKQIDDLEQMVVTNAAKVSANLNEHVSICGAVRQETARLTGIVGEMRRKQEEYSRELSGGRHLLNGSGNA
jgi:hypothetical protein